MKKSLILKLFVVVSVVMISSTRPVGAFLFPTLDATAVGKAIQTGATQTKTAMDTVEKTLNVQNMINMVGDRIGSLEKFKDAEEKAKKQKEKAERMQARLEKLKEKKEKWEKRIEKAKAKYDAAQKFVNDTKSQVQGYIDEGKDLYNQGMDMYNQGKDMYNSTVDQAKGAIDQAKGYADQAQGYVNQAKGNTSQTESNFNQNSGYSTQNNQRNTYQTPVQSNMGTFEFDEEAFTEVPSETGEFSEGAWETLEEVELEDEDLEDEDADEQTVTEMPQEVGGVPLSETSQRRAFRKLPKEDQEVKPATEMPQTETPKTNLQTEMPKETLQTEMPKATLQTEEAKPAQQTSAVENVFIQKPMSFAQLGGTMDYKTGTTDEDVFIFSDVIANKCGMGYEDISLENVENCVKTWVLAMNDPDATVANEAKDEYDNALHEHVAADAAIALDNMSYTASFDTKVADDLDEKSESLTNIRDEISMMGKVMSANSNVLIRTLQNNSAALVYDTLKEVKLLTKDYYETEEEEK